MERKLLIAFIHLFSGAVFGDILVSNFENGWNNVAFGSDWFYFSDRSNGGNSKIMNAIEKPEGSYEAFKPDTPGYLSNNCGTVKFKLGDSFPVDNDGGRYYSFAGMGTDVHTFGRIADFRGAAGIHFWAKGTEGFTVCCDAVTSDILDNSYFRAYIILSENWTHYILYFDDFTQPPHYRDWLDTGKVDASKLEKITWKIFIDMEGRAVCRECDYARQDSGYFSLDGIYLMGKNWEPTSSLPVKPALSCQPISKKYHCVMDCLGRQIISAQRFQPSGMYIWKKGKALQKRIISR